jgi:hypothetical protein
MGWKEGSNIKFKMDTVDKVSYTLRHKPSSVAIKYL